MIPLEIIETSIDNADKQTNAGKGTRLSSRRSSAASIHQQDVGEYSSLFGIGKKTVFNVERRMHTPTSTVYE